MNELYHHGVKGQKWGVKNGPPYPLKPEQKTNHNLEGKLGLAPEVAYAVAVATTMVISKAVIKAKAEKYFKEHREELQEQYDNLDNIKYSDINHVNNRKTRDYMNTREDQKTDKDSGLKLKKADTTKEEDMAAVNPEYNTYNYARYNCALCSMTYDMRRRGYDVIAGYTDEGTTPKVMEKYYPGSKHEDLAGDILRSASTMVNAKRLSKEQCDNAIRKISEQKDSRGAINVYWYGYNAGHSMAYDVDSNGIFTIRDCQSNQSYTGDKALSLLRKTSYVGYIRTDNVKPDIEAMKKDGVIR